jgi:vitamin K-dependent gamma-carboxylase
MAADGGEHVKPEPSPLRRLVGWLHRPEDPSGLAVFRMLWGGLMAWEAYRYLAAGWVSTYYIKPDFTFKYMGFEWVEPLPGAGMYIVHYAMIFAGIAIAIGLYYRVAATLFFVAHTYTFLLEAANYLNHAYLISVLAFMLIFVPANRALSIDAWRNKDLARSQIPKWPRATLLAQLTVVYIYGGVAKLNSDWLVYHQPVRKWMDGSAEKAPYFKDFIASEFFTQFVCYGGVLFDLTIAPLLLWRRTRLIVLPGVIGFHLTNDYLFSIGVFPWLMIAATTLFFEPDWPRRLPKIGARIGAFVDAGGPWVAPALRLQWRTLNVLAVWFVVQILLPLRHLVYPGDVAWNEDGHYLSWRMKLRSKNGSVKMRVVDRESGRTWLVEPTEYLSKRQARKLTGKPDLIRQFAHYLVDIYREEEGIEVDVYAEAWCTLNYRAKQRFIDPEQELGHLPASLGPYDWVLPFVWSEPPHPGNEAGPQTPGQDRGGD